NFYRFYFGKLLFDFVFSFFQHLTQFLLRMFQGFFHFHLLSNIVFEAENLQDLAVVIHYGAVSREQINFVTWLGSAANATTEVLAILQIGENAIQLAYIVFEEKDLEVLT